MIIASNANDGIGYLPLPWKKDLEKTLKDTAVSLIVEMDEKWHLKSQM